jgi:hypothetical protein
MNTQIIGLKRNKTNSNLDKYYTNKNNVDMCLKHFKHAIQQYGGLSKENDIIIEPSAGNGAFIDGCKKLCDNCFFYDIEPEHNDIVKQDYLAFNYSTIQNTGANIHVIGNPPFGRQSSLAIKFIRYSALFSNSISFILPKSFMKESMKSKVPLNFHLIYETELEDDNFHVNDTLYNVPCIFQIWIKKNIQRKPFKKLKPNGYEFVKKEEQHDIAFRRVGVYAGKIYKETTNKSSQSHYFIKFEGGLNDDLYNNLCEVKFADRMNTVGPNSISKQELIKVYNPMVNICKYKKNSNNN